MAKEQVSASSRRGDLKKSITNIASECRIANIVRNHAMILADDATPKPDGIFGKDTTARVLAPYAGNGTSAACPRALLHRT